MLLIGGSDDGEQCVGGCVGEDDSRMSLLCVCVCVCRKKKEKTSCQEARDRLVLNSCVLDYLELSVTQVEEEQTKKKKRKNLHSGSC